MLRLLVPHAVAIALTAPPVVLLAFLAPGPLLLPALSLAAMTVAAVAALLGWARQARWDANRITVWDIAGALVFIGCAAGMLSRPENVLQLFGVSAVP